METNKKLEDLKVSELESVAKEMGIENIPTKKDDIIAVIKDHQTAEAMSKPPVGSGTKKSEDQISVSKTSLEKLIDRLESSERTVDELKEMVRKTANKSRLMRWDDSNRKATLRRVCLSEYDGKIVLGWKTLVDEVFKDQNKVWQEKQIMEVFLEDESSVELTYKDFFRKLIKVEAEIKARNFDEVNGTETLKVETIKTGKTYDIGNAFIN